MSLSRVVLLTVLTVAWAAGYNYNYYYQQYPTLCGLSALRGAAYYNYASRRSDYSYLSSRRRYRSPHQRRNKVRHGRVFQDSPDEGENLLFSAVDTLDDEGCILKLLCHLQASNEADNTLEESVLLDMFANITVTPYNAPFIHATDIGSRTQNTTECDTSFSNCPLIEAQLRDLLQQAWGCGGNPFNDDRPLQQQNIQILDQQNPPQASQSARSYV